MVLLPGSAVGQGVFIFSKLWILLLPALWFFFIERESFPRGETQPGGFRMGWLTGLAISAFIVAVYLLLGNRMIDTAVVGEVVAGIKLDRPLYYVGASLYWVCINSILEEYVWRWFVVRQFSKIFHPTGAIVASALGFTLHHILAMQVYFSWTVTSASAACILFAGALWSWMFIRYRTIWPGWLSHALVDITVFGIGYVLIFS